MVAKKKSVNVENVFVMIALIVLNVLFVVHVFVGWIGVLIGFIAGSIAMVVGGIAGFVASVAGSVVGGMLLGSISPAALIFLSVALICLGGLWMIGNFYLVKYSYKAVV